MWLLVGSSSRSRLLHSFGGPPMGDFEGALVGVAGKGRPGRVQLPFFLAIVHPFCPGCCLVSRMADGRGSLRTLNSSENFRAPAPEAPLPGGRGRMLCAFFFFLPYHTCLCSLSSLELCQDSEKSFVSSREVLCVLVEMRSQFGSQLCNLE